jgi:hypothetical protein
MYGVRLVRRAPVACGHLAGRSAIGPGPGHGA